MAKKKASPKGKRVRLQVPVSSVAAGRIDRLSKRLGRTQGSLVGLLLEDIIENQEKTGEWFFRNVVRAVRKTVRTTKRERKQSKTEEMIRIQAVVPEEVADEVAFFAERMGNSQLKTAGWLVEQSLDDSDWIISFVTSKPVDYARDVLGVPRRNSGAKTARKAPKGRKTK